MSFSINIPKSSLLIPLNSIFTFTHQKYTFTPLHALKKKEHAHRIFATMPDPIKQFPLRVPKIMRAHTIANIKFPPILLTHRKYVKPALYITVYRTYIFALRYTLEIHNNNTLRLTGKKRVTLALTHRNYKNSIYTLLRAIKALRGA